MSRKKRASSLNIIPIMAAILIAGVLVMAGLASLSTVYEPNATTPTPSLTPSLEAATIIDMPVGQVVSQQIALTYEQPVATISAPSATYIQPFFSVIDIAPGDLITVSSADGAQLRVYGAHDVGLWAFPIDGSSAVLTLVPADPTATGYSGVVIGQYGRGSTPIEVAQSVCGSNDMTDVACSANSHPTEYALRQPVARMLYTNGGTQFVCTTWRVSPGNFMITNEHCIKSQAALNTAVIRFNYQRATCGGGNLDNFTEVRGGTLLMVNATYDVALFSLHPDDFARVEQYGYLELDTDAPAENEIIFIPQHPGGMPMQFGLNSNQDGGRCRVKSASLMGYAQGSDFGYACDTQGGSSGSPVIAADTMRVIGLHHLGSGRTDGAACGPSPHYNQAVKIQHIAPLIAPYIGGQPPAAPNPTMTPDFALTAAPTAIPDMPPAPTSTAPASVPPVGQPTPYPTATPLRTTIDILRNGGFEQGMDGWDHNPLEDGDGVVNTNPRSLINAFQFSGGDGKNVVLRQIVSLEGRSFEAGDTLELIAHIDTVGAVDGFMRLILTYKDGRIRWQNVPFASAGRYEPRAIEYLIDSPDIEQITVLFRNVSTAPDSKVYLDDIALLHSRRLP